MKDHTGDLHARAEHHVRILDRDATVEDYVRYLVAMRGFHAAIETAFAADRALAAAGYDAASRQKSQWLIRDLDTLCVHAPGTNATLRFGALPDTGELAYQLGRAYVVEGATLGGKFILAHLPPGLAGLRGTATAFLEGYGAATAERWRALSAIVERAVTTAAGEAAAIAGARDTFARLIDWLARFEPADARRGRPMAAPRLGDGAPPAEPAAWREAAR